MTEEKTINRKPTVIPSGKVDAVKAAVAKLQRRAAKLKLPVPEISFSKPYILTKTSEFTGFKTEVEVVDMTITNSEVKIPGFTYLAKLEPTKGGNMVYPVPGVEIDEKYHTSGCYCDHCKTNRFRNRLYVFRKDDDGSQIQVGSTCLKDYMGISATAMAYWASLDYEIRETGEESWDGDGGGGSSYYIDLQSFTAIVAAVIEHEGGYVSNAAAQTHDVSSTSALACIACWPNSSSKKQLAYSREIRSMVTEEINEKAREAIRWIAEDWTDTGDYAWNLKLIAKNGAMLAAKQFGIGASLWPTYVRQIGWLKEKAMRLKAEAEAVADSEYVGKEGERLRNLKATVMAAFFVGNRGYGDTYLYKFLTEKGEVLSWFSGGRGLTKGDEVNLTGTVKGHKEYKGVKETQVTRCKVVKEGNVV